MTYSGTRVLVTGANGFIGSHLVEALVAEGAAVRAFCQYDSNGSRGWLDHVDSAVADQIDFVFGDVRDARFVEETCEGVAVVFHLAALIAIPYSYHAPQSFIETNVTGTLNVLEAVRRHACGRLVQTSTSEVYGTPATVPILETHPLQGQSPYAASKIGADKLCEAYHHSFDVPVVTLRPFNTYGPRQSTRAIIPTVLAQLLSGATRVELGNLAPRRDLTFISDTVEGFLLAGRVPGLEGDVIQLGTGRSWSVADLLAACCSVLSVEAEAVIREERVRPARSEVMVLESDPGRARERLGWEPRVELEQGLKITARWVEKVLPSLRQGRHVL